jgi:hypothetical protein
MDGRGVGSRGGGGGRLLGGRGGLLYGRAWFLFCWSGSRCFATLKDVPDLLRYVHRDGAGVCLLFGHTQARQKIDNRFGLDL